MVNIGDELEKYESNKTKAGCLAHFSDDCSAHWLEKSPGST